MKLTGKFPILRHIRLYTLAVLACVVSATVFADNSALNRMQALLKQVPRSVHVGVLVFDAASGNTVFAQNAYEFFTPASVQKVLTATAGFILLGPHFRYATTLQSQAPVTGNTLSGNLVVHFSGDPTLTSQDLTELFTTLQAQGVTKILGDVVINDRDFDNVPYPAGFDWEDLSFPFGAPISAIMLDRNAFSLRITPTNRWALIQSSLPNGVIHIENAITITKKWQNNCPIKVYSDINNRYLLRGCLPRNVPTQYRGVALRNPIPYAMLRIKCILTQLNISYTGVIRVATPHDRVRFTLVTHNSDDLQTLVTTMLKKSDNLIANTLLKKMGQQFTHQPGSWQNGVKALKTILHTYGQVDFTGSTIEDGAGLSRYNAESPREFGQVLYLIHQTPALRTCLWNALPISGHSGTLKWRMSTPALKNRVHAKTGTMKGISSLTGFVTDTHNHVFGFAILVNGFSGRHYAPYHILQDRLCAIMASGSL
ncbi:MAG: D-alanyl-D-alanine carboxypeptidase/D-alanyl-D-alanine-endopeptidase [Gammaproteobacteria bacterium RIFCSPHIGHO2_12_FULL_45_9]|nr:MAG: D-alanyl-D-alanine carboxypeptidase/D-alanyl-D-alanine-endopeptidase [Gammaproteobacteria bacterium RIFCSPHIGHO2_12_FULL_45_9]